MDPPMENRAEARRAVVVGGGIAGLCAAYDLVAGGWDVEIHEAEGRWGGKVWSSPVGDRLVDAGPDTFLARVEPGRQLCRDLGLEQELTSPVAPIPAYLARAGALHELPAGSMLGVPTDFDGLRRSGLISDAGIERARVDLTAAPTPIEPDISVGALCRARLGDEITDRLIDPLLGGINASDIDRLSLAAGAPLLAEAMTRSHSLTMGLAQLRPTTGPTLGTEEPTRPVFYGLPGGIARIIDALIEELTGRANLRLHSPVSELRPLLEEADAVVVANPAFAASELVRAHSPSAADLLAGIEYASVAQVVVELATADVEQELDASGILFPRVEGTMLTACTWLSTKWAHYRRPDSVLLRLSSGRFGDDRPQDFDDETLIPQLLGDLGTVMKVTGEPLASRVQRLPRAFPQYTPGHNDRVEQIFAAMTADCPRIRLTGAAYHGIGLPACIEDGRETAAGLIDDLG